MEGKRFYLQPEGMIFDAALGVMELQKGKERANDPLHGELYFDVVLFGIFWKLGFKVRRIDNDRSCVIFSIKDSVKKDDDDCRDVLESMITNEFALLDSVLLAGTPRTITYKEAGSTKMEAKVL